MSRTNPNLCTCEQAAEPELKNRNWSIVFFDGKPGRGDRQVIRCHSCGAQWATTSKDAHDLSLMRKVVCEPDYSGKLSEGQNYTPGPWFVGHAPVGHCRIYSRADGHAIARTYGNGLDGIGVCDLTGHKNEADAVLISAAPELLEALIRMVNIYDAMNGPRCPSRIIADAAIAKATGGAA